MKLFQIYNPITATPFARNDNYMEFEPCDALKPYIKCFWGTKNPVKQLKSDISIKGVVTPDTCMDILFDVDFTNNKISNRFCGISDRTFYTHNFNYEEKIIFTFAIRFYAWSVIHFAEESMRDTHNVFLDVDYHFSKIKREIEPLLFDVVDMGELISTVEKILIRHYHAEHGNTLVLEAISKILMRKGNIKIEQISKELHISNRQLQRLFQEYVGVSPKNLASMMRYQYVWNDILYSPQFNV